MSKKKKTVEYKVQVRPVRGGGEWQTIGGRFERAKQAKEHARMSTVAHAPIWKYQAVKLTILTEVL